MPDLELEITPGQALLLLINHYNNNPTNNPHELEHLKRLYLSGTPLKRDREALKELLSSDFFNGYKILYDAKSINNDPTRRYFETHLAYETLTFGLKNIQYKDLNVYYEHAYKAFTSAIKFKMDRCDTSMKWYDLYKSQYEIIEVLFGRCTSDSRDMYKQYANYIDNIKNGKIFPTLSPEERAKVELLVKCTFLGIVNAWFVDLPINIYNSGFYAEEQKGKIMKKEQQSTHTQHAGLMKSYMPLPETDIAIRSEIYPYHKPSDQANFVPHAKWIKHNFLRMVHPYSNSISGTMLCQLRLLAHFKNLGHHFFTEDSLKMSRLIKLIASSALYNSGGHTLFEFIEPLKLPQVMEAFEKINGFKDITLESMFITDNISAFNLVMNKTIEYNLAIIQRMKFLKELKSLWTSKLDGSLVLKVSLKRIFTEYDASEDENIPPSNKRSKC